MSEVKLEVISNDDNTLQDINDTKEKIAQKIAVIKFDLKEENKKLKKIENRKVETTEDIQKKDLDKSEVTANIKSLQAKLVEYQLDLEQLKKTQANSDWEDIEAALNDVQFELIEQNSSVAYIIKDQQYVFIRDFSKSPEIQNVQIVEFKPGEFVQFVANELKLKPWHLPAIHIQHLFNQCNRTFQISRYTVDPRRWDDTATYMPIQHMEQYFIDKCALTPEQEEMAKEALPYFDVLMYSLSGGKKENQDHIERWILHKVKNYNKAVTTPDLIIVGHVGGNGKGILQAIVRSMLPAMLSGKANTKTLNNQFNAIMMGKLIVFFDDQNNKEIPLDVVKQLAGSETMIFEPKGKDQYEGEKTHSSAWFAQQLPFRLTPAGQEGGVDRRFSIMATNITFLESLRKFYKEQNNDDITVEESKTLAEIVVGKYLLNRLNIAYWFKELERRHPEVNADFTLTALHGEDYHYFLDNQRSSYEIIWHDLITPVLRAGGCVPMFVIKELLRHMDDKIIGDKTINQNLKRLSMENKLEISSERAKILIYPHEHVESKQCTYIRPKLDNDFTNKSFNWSLVSSKPFAIPTLGRNWIEEDDRVFGTKHAVDDDEMEQQVEDQFEIRDRLFNKSWEEE